MMMLLLLRGIYILERSRDYDEEPQTYFMTKMRLEWFDELPVLPRNEFDCLKLDVSEYMLVSSTE